jgi:hypothetical protein
MFKKKEKNTRGTSDNTTNEQFVDNFISATLKSNLFSFFRSNYSNLSAPIE